MSWDGGKEKGERRGRGGVEVMFILCEGSR